MVSVLLYTQQWIMKNTLPLLLLLVIFSCCRKTKPAGPEPEPRDAVIKTRVLNANLTLPWEILYGPDNKIWMTERGGKISRVDTSTGAVTLLHTITEVVSQGEGGLLGMVLHPNFTAQPYVYVTYNYINAGVYKEKVVRFTYSNNTLINSFIFIDNIAAAGIHNGSRLLIVGDKLFITTGDAANQPLAQNISSPNGKILRLNLDGSIPADNPIAGNPLWSWGHRNPQGLVYANNILYSSEHGPDTDDEINIIEKGRNYGWPTVRGFCDNSNEQSFCTTNNIKEPIKAWTPTLAVCGLDYYNNNLIPQWKNSLLLCNLKASRLVQLKLKDDKKTVDSTFEYFTNEFGRLRDICISPDGKVYLCTSNGSGDRLVVVDRK